MSEYYDHLLGDLQVSRVRSSIMSKFIFYLFILTGELSQNPGDKKSERDFALWKASKPGEPDWDSPWGKVYKSNL